MLYNRLRQNLSNLDTEQEMADFNKCKFPLAAKLIRERSNKGLCTVCQLSVVSRPFLIFTVGAIYSLDGGKTGGFDEKMFGFMHVTRKNGPELESVPIFEDVVDGQADLYFCSRSCFREFLTSLLHLFEPPNADRPIEEM
jgi:hypothetical protein